MISQTPSKDVNSLNKTQQKSTNGSKLNYDTTKIVNIGKYYVLRKLIYKGKQFNIYLAINLNEQNKHYIIKMVTKVKLTTKVAQITVRKRLYKSYNKIQVFQNTQCLVLKRSREFFTNIKQCRLLDLPQNCVLILLGENFSQPQFAQLPSKLQFIVQINNEKEQLTILERLHNLGIVHRNLRPKKILTSTNMEQHNELYLIDFQNAVKLKKKSGKIFSPQQHPNQYVDRNTLNKFSSLAQHINLPCSPKDDLESLGYILVYFAQDGSLFNLKSHHNREEKMKQYEIIKLRMIPEEDFKEIPQEIRQYLNYIKMTNINEFPMKDYEFLKKIFRKLLINQGGNEKSHLEWVGVMKQQSEQRSQLYFLSQENTNRNLNQSFQVRLETKKFGKFVSFSADLPKVEVPKVESPKTLKQPTPAVLEILSESEKDSDMSDNETDSISNNMRLLQENVFSPKLKNIFTPEQSVVQEIQKVNNRFLINE